MSLVQTPKCLVSRPGLWSLKQLDKDSSVFTRWHIVSTLTTASCVCQILYQGYRDGEDTKTGRLQGSCRGLERLIICEWQSSERLRELKVLHLGKNR